MVKVNRVDRINLTENQQELVKLFIETERSPEYLSKQLSNKLSFKRKKKRRKRLNVNKLLKTLNNKLCIK